MKTKRRRGYEVTIKGGVGKGGGGVKDKKEEQE